MLYLRPPAGEPLAECLRAVGVPAAEPAPGVIAVPLAPGLLAHLAEALPTILTDATIRGTRALVAADGLPPSLADLFATLPLTALLAAVRGRWLSDVLRDGRLVTHFQPIVLADDPVRVFGYECLVRGLTPSRGAGLPAGAVRRGPGGRPAAAAGPPGPADGHPVGRPVCRVGTTCS